MIIQFFLLLSIAQGAILKTSTILEKLTNNSGTGSYQVELEVAFPNQSTSDTLTFRETWIIENEEKMKLTVQGTNDLQEQIKWVYFYDNGNRIQNLQSGKQSKKISEDFFEKYFHFRSVDSLGKNLIKLQVISSQSLTNKPFKLGQDTDLQQDPMVRLSRVGGVPAFALGQPTSVESENGKPGMWIEQDQFVLRKLRFPSEVEITAEQFLTHSRGLNFPKSRFVRWGSNSINIQTISVTPLSGKPLSNANLEQSTRTDILDGRPEKILIEEFYKRFR